MEDSKISAFPFRRKDGVSEATVAIEVHGDTRHDLFRLLTIAIADREIPPEECLGLFGWDGGFVIVHDVPWSRDSRLHPEMAVIWHPRAIIPPALLLMPEAVIYGRVGHSNMARYR